jgi:AcrR family transcriptional regulator
MNEASPARYSSALREKQKAGTRDLILEAVGRCMQDRGLEDLSFADVAASAAVSERTVYRHFPTKDALLDAYWSWLHGSLGIDAFPETAADLIALPRKVFGFFDEHEAIIRGMMASRQGREVRLRVNTERQAAIRKAVQDAAPRLAEPDLTRTCASVQLLYSATGWLTMKDYWGLAGAEAGEAASQSIATLLAYARLKGETP